MKHTLKKNSETQVHVTVTLDENDLATAKKVSVQHLAKSVKVPGFRAGKVPANVAERPIDPLALANDGTEHAINISVNDIAEAEDLRILDRPQVELGEFEPFTKLVFEATIEIVPEIVLGDYKKLKAKRGKVAVDDKEIDDVVERMRGQLAEKKPAERKEAKDGDEVNIDFVGKQDDKPFDGGTAKGYDLTLGSNSFIPGFEEAIVGHKVGETFDVPLTFPEDYHADNLKGAKVVFEVTLNAINEVVLPEVDDKFAEKVGPFKSVDGMREDIRAQLLQQKEKEADDKLKDDLMGELVEASKIPVPQLLVDDQIRQIEQDFTQNLMYSGMSPDQYLKQQGYKDHDEMHDKEFRPAAVRRVQAGLVLSELSKVENIEVSKDELDARHAEMLSQYPTMKEQLETPEARRDIANRVITEKTVNRLVELNTKK